MMIFSRCLFVVCFFALSTMASDCSSSRIVLDSVNAFWNRSYGSVSVCGQSIEHQKSSIVSWEKLYEKLFKDSKVLCEQYLRLSKDCEGDTIKLRAFNNNVIVEQGPSESQYYIYGNFPVLFNGLKPGISKKNAKAMCGVPRIEDVCKLQYRTSNNKFDMVLVFKNDSLKVIMYGESTCGDD